MNNIHIIPNRGRALSELLAEERKDCYGNPARRAALMIAQRVTEDAGWHHNNENAVQFMRGNGPNGPEDGGKLVHPSRPAQMAECA